jgi:hypothetical protein
LGGDCQGGGGTGILVVTAGTAVSRLCVVPLKRTLFRDSLGQTDLECCTRTSRIARRQRRWWVLDSGIRQGGTGILPVVTAGTAVSRAVSSR